MPVDNAEGVYSIDRKAASKLLKVSMRTLDRYVHSKKLSSVLIDGRVWLNKGELFDFVNAGERRHSGIKSHVSTSGLSIDSPVYSDVDSVDNEHDRRSENFLGQSSEGEVLSNKSAERSEAPVSQKGGRIYKKLYLELKEELKEKQDRLEIANYRVGQLESQIRNSVPMLEYHREKFDREKAQKELKSKLESAEDKLAKTLPVLRYEKLTKRIFMAALLTLLALQPLWLLFSNSFE